MAARITKVTSLTHNAGTITAVVSGITYTVSVGSPTANTLYMIYLTPAGLVISTNVNSVGPAGASAWVLVGAFYSNGIGSPAFGAFVNIDGIPACEGIQFTPTNPTNATVGRAMWGRIGNKVKVNNGFQYTNTGSTTFAKNQILPTSLQTVDTTPLGYYLSGVNRSVVGFATGVDVGTNGYPATVIYDHSADNFFIYISTAFAIGNTDVIGMDLAIPIAGLSNTPLKDL